MVVAGSLRGAADLRLPAQPAGDPPNIVLGSRLSLAFHEFIM